MGDFLGLDDSDYNYKEEVEELEVEYSYSGEGSLGVSPGYGKRYRKLEARFFSDLKSYGGVKIRDNRVYDLDSFRLATISCDKSQDRIQVIIDYTGDSHYSPDVSEMDSVGKYQHPFDYLALNEMIELANHIDENMPYVDVKDGFGIAEKLSELEETLKTSDFEKLDHRTVKRGTLVFLMDRLKSRQEKIKF